MAVSYPLAVLAAVTISGCSAPEPQAEISSFDEACQTVKSALIALHRYRASQIASCDGGKDAEHPGFYTTRVNAYCHEEICGSVLLGWYAVEEATGQVYDWDYTKWAIGAPMDRKD